MTVAFTDPNLLVLLALLPLLWYLALGAARGRSRVRAWTALAVRTLLMVALILALAGAHLRVPSRDVAVVFLVDVSDSVPPAVQAQAVEYVRTALANKPPEGRAGVVVFGRDALVERTVGDLRTLDALESVPVRTHTDIEEAIRLGLALLPAEAQGRLVLLSDGQANEGRVERAVKLAAARGVPVDVVPIEGGTVGPEVALAQLGVPQQVREGQTFQLTVALEATTSTQARLRVWDVERGLPIYDEVVDVPPGRSQVTVPVRAEEGGAFRYRATVEPVSDMRPENNVAEAVVFVLGPPRVLVVAQEPAEVEALVTALQDAGMEVVVQAPAALPQETSALAAYDTVILANVPAVAVTPAAQKALRAFVRDLGHGLIMVGGPQSFGAGLWHRTPVEEALPVSMDVRAREQEPSVALVMVVDKSGSMDRCHCSDPTDVDTMTQRVLQGLPKVDIAKEAIIQATFALGQADVLGIVAFDRVARWVLEPQPYPGQAAVEQAIAGIEPRGGTNIFAGLAAAEEKLSQVRVRIRHIILVTDGWSRAGDYQALAARLREEGITLSVVAAGRGAALQDLARMATEGGGRFYPADSLDDIPKIFLKETIRIAGRYIVEEPFRAVLMTPSPVLQGVDVNTMPLLLGYNGTTVKEAATEVLNTLEGDPLLAHWQYGLGRSVAWTSDLTGRWGRELVAWESFGDFVAQLVAWTLPQRTSDTLSVEADWDGNTVRLRAVAREPDGQPRNFVPTEALVLAPDGQTARLELPQVGPGEYEATFSPDQVGAYLVTVIQRSSDGAPLDQVEIGLVVPYSPEYRLTSSDPNLLRQVATATGGRLAPPSEEVFVPTGANVYHTRPLWPVLLVLAALLLPLDVAVRRLIVGWRELAEALAMVGRLWGAWRVPAPAAPHVPERPELFQARERARRRQRVPPSVSRQPAPREHSHKETPSPPEPTRPEVPTEEGEEDTLARLRAAKRRRRR